MLFDGDELAMAGSAEDPVAGIVLGAVRPHSVYVNGRRIVGAGELLTADSATIAGRQRMASARLMQLWRESPRH